MCLSLVIISICTHEIFSLELRCTVVFSNFLAKPILVGVIEPCSKVDEGSGTSRNEIEKGS